MKTKLLKKLRKRFFWYQETNLNTYTLIDKKYKRKIYAFNPSFFFYSDMLIYEMMSIIGLRFFFKKKN